MSTKTVKLSARRDLTGQTFDPSATRFEIEGVVSSEWLFNLVARLRFPVDLGTYSQAMASSAGARVARAADSVIAANPETGASFEIPVERELSHLRAEVEQLRVQLAGCLTAAEGATQYPAEPGQYGWSLAYQKTLELRIAYEAAVSDLPDLKSRVTKLEARQATARAGHRWLFVSGDEYECAKCKERVIRRSEWMPVDGCSGDR